MVKYLIIALSSILFYSCTPSVEPINYGNDECNFCKMSIVDQRYGAEILTTKGKVFKYDAVECMINALCENQNNSALNLHSAYIIDFSNPGKLSDAKTSYYLYSKQLPSPMGAYLTAFSDSNSVYVALDKFEGQILNWKNVILKVVGKQTCEYEL